MGNKVKYLKRGKMYYYPTEKYLNNNDNVSTMIYLGTDEEEKEISNSVGFYETYEEAKEAANKMDMVSDKRLKMMKQHEEILRNIANEFHEEHRNIVGNNPTTEKDEIEFSANIAYSVIDEQLCKMSDLLHSITRRIKWIHIYL